jgi:hypothetical protein
MVRVSWIAIMEGDGAVAPTTLVEATGELAVCVKEMMLRVMFPAFWLPGTSQNHTSSAALWLL